MGVEEAEERGVRPIHKSHDPGRKTDGLLRHEGGELSVGGSG